MKLKDILLTLSVISIWGVNIMMVRIGVSELPPLLLTGLRFILVAALVIPFRRHAPTSHGKLLLLTFVLGFGHYGLLFVGVVGLGAGTTAIVLQLCVTFSALLAAFFYKERMGFLGWLGIVLAMAGVVVIEGEPVAPDFFSLMMVLVSAFCWALANIIVKKIGPVDALALNGWVAFYGAPMLLLFSALLEHGQFEAIRNARLAGWGAVVYTAFMASIVSYTIWYRLVGRLPMNRVVPFNLLTPVIAISGGALLLGEPMGMPTYIGAACTILGVAVIQLRPSPKGQS